jgi:hypothetical protein
MVVKKTGILADPRARGHVRRHGIVGILAQRAGDAASTLSDRHGPEPTR